MRTKMKKVAIGMIGAIILFVGASCGGGGGGTTTTAAASTTGAADGYVYESIDGDMDMVARTTGRLPGILPLIGASVECEGKTALTTSRGYFMLTGLPAGSRIINATKPGYRPIKIPVIIRRNDTVHAVEENSATGALEPESSGQVAVSSTPAGAVISIDGRETAFITPNTLNNIVAGQHVISVALSGYNAPEAVTVMVSGDATANAAFTLSAESAAEENTSQPDTDTTPEPSPTPDPWPVTASTYVIVDTAQAGCYSDTSNMTCAGEGTAFSGQDAQYDGAQPSYTDNGDGTVTDNVTGLMWQKDPGAKMTMAQAQDVENTFNLAGYSDWRLPTIKELYSLIMFYGTDPSSSMYSSDTSGLTPFIDMDYFDFEYGDTTQNERIIDSQFLSSNVYVGDGFDAETVFGVNFADGRIKGYGTTIFGREKTFFVMFVRGGNGYGENDFVDNGNGTVADYATGLTWTQDDSGEGMVWEDALSYCEDMNFAGSTDWRLPNAKELQSILDYSRAPSLTNSAAIDPLFNVSEITNEGGVKDYPYFWTSTTHVNQMSGGSGVYVSFGRGLGYMNYSWVDVHGAGAQRSDPKSGDPSVYPTGHGPQGDAIRIYNYARCVRGGATKNGTSGDATEGGNGGGVGSAAASGTDTTGGTGSVQSSTGQGGITPPAPPQEAIDACTGKTEGAVCTVILPLGNVTGTCVSGIATSLACVPSLGRRF